MKRVDLSPEKLDEVIYHRQAGLSWRAVSEATNVTARIARRSYEQWEKRRSVDDLENIRIKVGEHEFERHLATLSEWAIKLVDRLSLKEYPDFPDDDETYSSLIGQDSIIPFLMTKAMTRDVNGNTWNARQNSLIYKSIQQHTADIIRWEIISEWEEGRKTRLEVKPGIEKSITYLVNSLYIKLPNLAESFTSPLPKKKLKEEISNAFWKEITTGEPGNDIVKVEMAGSSGENVLRITVGNISFLQNPDPNWDLSFSECCRQAINELHDTREVKELIKAVGQMQQVVGELEETLDPLVLRPLILRTRCRLCPA